MVAAFAFWIVATIIVQAELTTATLQDHGSMENAATTSWPSLRVHFSVKRSSRKLHGQSEFMIVADPVVSIDDSTRVLYNTFGTLTENSTVFSYTLVNGVSYVSTSDVDGSAPPTVKCSTSNYLPSVNSLFAGLSDAIKVSGLPPSIGNAEKCSNADSVTVSIEGAIFRLCYSSSEGFSMFGSDMDVKVNYVRSSFAIKAPALRANSNLCEAVTSSYSVTFWGQFLLQGQPGSSTTARSLRAASIFSPNVQIFPTCSCKSTPRPCIFIHGQGVDQEMAENLDSYPSYWGNMTQHAPCCTSIKYAMLNTQDHGWTENELQQKVCDRVLAVSTASINSTISDTIIVTHSMGGLMMAAAVASGKCSFAPSVTWVSTGSPMRGSMASNYLLDACHGGTNLFVKDFANITGRCPATAAIQSLAYENSTYASPELNQAYKDAQEVYRTHVKAAMCSFEYTGLISKYQWQFLVLGKVMPHYSGANDGVVEFQSCTGGIPESMFGRTYRDQFYMTKLNHFDVTFRSGNALQDEAKMPVKWFECLL